MSTTIKNHIVSQRLKIKIYDHQNGTINDHINKQWQKIKIYDHRNKMAIVISLSKSL
jgi:hypothetical protein